MTFPIVFIYKGTKLPKYVEYSLKMNREFSPGIDIYFLSNVFSPNKVNGVIEVDINSFYLSSFSDYFESSKKNKWWDGFWNNTIERFFILEAFMKEYNLENVVHMELDNLGFDLYQTCSKIVGMRDGLYYPTYEGNTSAASIFFVNGISSLKKFNSFVLKNNNLSDMELLYLFRSFESEITNDLPVDSFDELSESLGIFDHSYIGQYLFGTDKRILTKINRNLILDNWGFINSLIGTNGYFLIKNMNLILYTEKNFIKVNNVHVHSKIFKKLSNSKYFDFVLKNINNRISIVIDCNLLDILKNLIIKNLIKIKVKSKYWIKKN